MWHPAGNRFPPLLVIRGDGENRSNREHSHCHEGQRQTAKATPPCSWPGTRRGCLRSLPLSFVTMRVFSVTAVFSITPNYQKRWKSVTGWMPHIGTVV